MAIESRFAEGKYGSASQARGRAGALQGGCDRHLEHASGPGGQARHHDDPHRHRIRWPIRSGAGSSPASRAPAGTSPGGHTRAASCAPSTWSCSRTRFPARRASVSSGTRRTRSINRRCRTSKAPPGSSRWSCTWPARRSPKELERAVSGLMEKRIQALVVFPDGMFQSQTSQIVELAARHRLPAVYGLREFAEAGGLMAYGANVATMHRELSASLVDKILKGAKPGEPSRRAADQVRAGDQPQDREGARPDDPAVAAGAGGSGDRVMERRAFLAGAAALLAAPLAVEAQQPERVYRIGFLWDSPTAFPDAIEAFRQGLHDLGYIEGRNLVIEYRWAEGKSERMRELAEELVRLKVDVIMAPSSTYTEAAKRATSTIPIVFMSHADPLRTGHVASLGRPGGNITGLSIMMTETNVKGLELLKEAVPGLARVAVIWDPATPSHGPGLEGGSRPQARPWGSAFNRWPCAARRSTRAPFRPSSKNEPTGCWSFQPACSLPGQSGSRNSH